MSFNPLLFTGITLASSSGGGGGGSPTIGDAVTGSTPNTILRVDASGNLDQIGPLTNGQLIIGSTGAPAVPATLTGTSSQIIVTNGAGSITLSLPQSIATASSPTFSGLTLNSFSSSGVVHNNSSGALSTSLIVNADVASSAAIAVTKLAPLSLSLPVRSDASGFLTTGSTNINTETTGVLSVAKGGTNSSAALNNNRIVISSGSAIVETAAIAGNKAIASDSSGLPVASTTTDTELGYVSGVTSSIQTQLDARSLPQAPSVNAWVYVSQYGNDTTGDGTYNKPFATTVKAQSIITDASTTKRYGIHIRGTITETNIYLAPYTWYYGDAWGVSRLNASSGSISLDPSKFATGNSRCGLTNVYLTGSTGISLDFVGLSASGSHVIEMQDVGINGSVIITPNNTNQYFQWRGALCFGDLTIHGAGGSFTDVFFVGNLTVNNGTADIDNLGVNLVSSIFGGNLSLSNSVGHTNSVQLNACNIAGTTTLTGSGTTLLTDSISIGLKSSITVSSGATLTRTTDAYNNAYTPSTSGDWSVVPVEVSGALDTLASKIYSKTYNVDKFTLNGTDISNKFVTLSSIPTVANLATLDIINGIEQDYSVDFTISGNQLSWNGLTLDGVLVSGDKLIVQYN